VTICRRVRGQDRSAIPRGQQLLVPRKTLQVWPFLLTECRLLIDLRPNPRTGYRFKRKTPKTTKKVQRKKKKTWVSIILFLAWVSCFLPNFISSRHKYSCLFLWQLLYTFSALYLSDSNAVASRRVMGCFLLKSI